MNKPNGKTLTLNTETLRRLTVRELQAVGGGFWSFTTCTKPYTQTEDADGGDTSGGVRG